jgi:Protein of unknown function (DUF2637)
MSAVTIPAPALDRREALAAERDNARALYRTSMAQGRPLTGPQLAELTGRTQRWCTTRINEVKAEGRPVPLALPPAPEPEPVSVPEPEPAPVAVDRSDSESRPAVSPWLERMAFALVALVFIICSVTSYIHQRSFAEEAGEEMSALLPLTVDALVFAALLTGHVFRKLDQKVPFIVHGCLWLGVTASVAANVSAAHPTPEGVATAAWPPVVAFLTHEMVTKLVDAVSAARRAGKAVEG